MLSNLTLGMAKVSNSGSDAAGEFLEYVLSRKNKFTQFSNDQNKACATLVKALIESLEEVESEMTLYDPPEWQSVLELIEAAAE